MRSATGNFSLTAKKQHFLWGIISVRSAEVSSILARGAEAVLSREGNQVIKERVAKPYRIEVLDTKLRKFRTKREGKLLQKCTELAPHVFTIDEKNMKITMEFIDGDLLRDVLDAMHREQRKNVLLLLGKHIAQLHDQGIIHGDLTTSNMILKNEKLFLIDFGLGFFSNKEEDKAVDLHLMKQALQSKHYAHADESFQFILEGYRNSQFYKETMQRFVKVESRGRYKGKQ